MSAQEGTIGERSTPHGASMRSQRSSDLRSSQDSDVGPLASNRVINERSSVPSGTVCTGAAREKPRKGSGSATPREGCGKDATISIGGAIVSSDDGGIGGSVRPRKDSHHRQKGSHKLRGFSLTGSAATIQRCAEMNAEVFTIDGVAAALTRCCCGVGSCAAGGRRTCRCSCRRCRRNYWPTPPSCSQPRRSNGECAR